MSEVRCKRVQFLSAGDENSFFGWAKSIPAVAEVWGERDEIILSLRAAPVDDDSLRELAGLLYRYEVPMSQLAGLESADNSAWFRRKGAYWYSSVFGAGKA
ncbi:hypothetical protein [Lysobacter sp. HA18]